MSVECHENKLQIHKVELRTKAYLTIIHLLLIHSPLSLLSSSPAYLRIRISGAEGNNETFAMLYVMSSL